LCFHCTFSRINYKKIIPHFDNYSLISQKHAYYLLFREVVMIMQRREHLTSEGIQTIINIRATLNWGLTPELKEAFPNSIPVPRLLVENSQIPHPEWVAGFTSGECYFFINIQKSDTTKSGMQIRLRFELAQHIRDEQLIKSLVDYFGCGRYYNYGKAGYYRCEKFQEIKEIIMPFFFFRNIKS